MSVLATDFSFCFRDEYGGCLEDKRLGMPQLPQAAAALRAARIRNPLPTTVKTGYPRKFSTALALVLITSAIAQTAPADRQSPPTPAQDAPIELSPFEVNDSQDGGYLAANSLAGSRLNTSLKDTAASISVFTREFLDDLGAQDIAEALVYGNNLQLNMDDQGTFGDAPGGNNQVGELAVSFRVRGISATVARNYFGWSLPVDTFNIERLDDSRGPNSVLFGLGSAGGVINATTKQAKLKQKFYTTSFTAGSYDSWRIALDVNQPLGAKVAVRLNALWNQSKGYKHHEFSERRTVHLAATYQVTPHWTARVELEKGRIETNRGRASGTFDAVTPWLNVGRPLFVRTDPNGAFAALGARLGNNQLRYISNSKQLLNMAGQVATNGPRGTDLAPFMDPTLADFSINAGGPGQLRPNPFLTYGAYIEGKLARKTFIELAFNHQDYEFEAHDPQQAHQLRGDPNATLPGTLGSNPFGGQLYMESNLRRVNRTGDFNTGRVTLATEIEAGRWGSYRIAALGEYRRARFTSMTSFERWNGAAPFNGNVIRRTYVREGDWASYHVHTPNEDGALVNITDPISAVTLSSKWDPTAVSENPDDLISGLLGLQGKWFDGRLVLGSGYRYDRSTIHDRGTRRNPTTNELEVDYGNVTVLENTGRTYTLGLVGHVTKNVSLMYNYANNFTLPGTNRVLPRGLLGDNPEGVGQDYGVAVDLMEGKLYARAVRYTVDTEGEFFSGGAPHQDRSNQILDGLLAARLITLAEHDARYLEEVNALSRDRESEGYEFSLTANPTKDWRLQINYSYTEGAENNIIPEVVSWWAESKAFYQRFRQDLPTGTGTNTIASTIQLEDDEIAEIRSVEGIGIIGNRKHKANFFARYTIPDGKLKGIYIGGGYRYQGKMLAGRTTDETMLQYTKPYGEASFLAGYSLRLKNRHRLSFQLNVSNLFDETDSIITRYYPAGDLTQVRRVIIREPRAWRLSGSHRF